MNNFIQPNANVRAVMALRGARGYQLAEVLNLQRTAMSERLSGKTDFRASELIKLSYFLQVPASQFFEHTGFGEEPTPTGIAVVDWGSKSKAGAA